MEEQKKTGRRLWWLIPLVLLLLAVAGVMLLFLVGSRGVSADADNPRAIRGAYEADSFAGASVQKDGSIELSLEKADLYWFAREYGLTEPIREWLDGDKERISAGFHLSGGQVNVSIRRRAWGVLPLSFRAAARMDCRDGALCLRFQQVRLGSRILLSEKRWPELFRQELVIDLSGTDFARELVGAELVGSTLRLRLSSLTAPRTGSLTRDPGTAAALRLFGREETGALPWENGTVTAEALCRSAAASQDARAFLAEGMSLCAREDLPLLWEKDSHIARQWLWEPLRIQEEQCRQSREKALSELQYPYEKLLQAARESYRSGALGILETGFYNPVTGETVHPGTLSKLSVTAIDSRIVFLTTAGDEAAPEEMPDLLTVPRKNWRTMDKDLNWKADVDLGVLLTTEGEVPILLYRRRDGTMVLREVTEELYVSAMVSRPIPQIDLDTLPPMTEVPRPAGEGFSGAVIGFLATS